MQEVSYAEAVKKVEEDGSNVRDPERIPVSSRSVPALRDKPTSDICFLAFLVMVIYCTAEMECQSQKIYVEVSSAGKYLGILDLTSEELVCVVWWWPVLPGCWHGATL